MFAEVLPEWVSNTGEELGKIWPLITLFGIALAFMRKWIKMTLHTAVRIEVEPMVSELKHNGGSSMKDAMRRMEKNQIEMKENQTDIASVVSDVDSKMDVLSARVLAIRSNTQAPYMEMDKDLKHTFVNAAYRRLFNVSYEEAMGDMQWENLVHPEDLDRLQQEVDRLKKSPTDYIMAARVLNRKEKLIYYITSYGFPINVGKTFTGYAVTISIDKQEPLPPELM